MTKATTEAGADIVKSEATTLVQNRKPLASVGTGYLYRKLLPAELPDYRNHLLRLALPDRQSRFHCTMTRLTIAEHCSKLDWLKTIVIGFFIDGVLRGTVELCASSPQWLDGAELAVSVEGNLQNGGAGTELVRRALAVAQNRSIRHVTIICLIHNRGMQKIVRKLHGRLDFDVTEALGDIELPQPTQMSLLQEMIDDGAAAAALPADRHQEPARAPTAIADGLFKDPSALRCPALRHDGRLSCPR